MSEKDKKKEDFCSKCGTKNPPRCRESNCRSCLKCNPIGESRFPDWCNSCYVVLDGGC